MTYKEFLWTIVAEECAEVAVRASKLKRFGKTQVQPGQDLDNRRRVVEEMTDLMGVLQLLGFSMDEFLDANALAAKKEKVQKYIALSSRLNRLSMVSWEEDL